MALTATRRGKRGGSMSEPETILLFMVGGQVQLQRDGATLWASDNDEEFRDEFEDEFLDPDEDAEHVLYYLMDKGVLTEDEAEAVEVESDSIDADSLDEEGDEDEDEEGEDPYDDEGEAS